MDMMALRRAVMSGQHLETVNSGNQQDVMAIAHFSTPTPAKVRNLIVNLPYKADGYTDVKVTHTGVNILQCYALVSGTNRTVIYTPYRNSAGEVERVHISGTADASNGFRNLNYDTTKPYAWPPNGAYATYGYSNSANVVFVGNVSSPKDRNDKHYYETIAKWKIYDLVHNTSNQQEWIRTQLVPFDCSGISYDDDIYPLVCLASDQGCAFEPYKGTTYTASFSKIYGGTIDLVSGKVIGTYAYNGIETSSEITTSQIITGQTINTLTGINNVWSDAGTITIKYWIH